MLPAAGLTGRREFVVERERDGLEPLIYTTVEKLHEDYKNDTRKSASNLRTKGHSNILILVTPQLLKLAVSSSLNKLLAPIQEAYHASPEWQAISLKAYPPPPKKEKKVKQKGTQHPGFKAENIKDLSIKDTP